MIEAVMAAGLMLAAAGDGFGSEGDREAAAGCVAVFLTLSDAATGRIDFPLPNPAEADLAAYRGFQRIKPFTPSAADGPDEAFASLVTAERNGWRRDLETSVSASDRQQALDGLNENVELCERLMDAWGAPPFAGGPGG